MGLFYMALDGIVRLVVIGIYLMNGIILMTPIFSLFEIAETTE